MKQTTIRRLISLGMLGLWYFCFLHEQLLSKWGQSAGNRAGRFRGRYYRCRCDLCDHHIGIDLSTGSCMALVGMTMANIYRYTLLPIWMMLLIGILVGLAAGLFNGFVVAKLHLPEFIATLATMGIFGL